jgi:hypothetical protein
MDKQLLTSVIEKYYLNGINEKVKWTVKDKKVQILFTSQLKDLAGSVEADEFDLEDCTLGIYDTNKLLKLVGITNQFIQLNVETKNGTSTKLNIADMEYDLTYHLADLRMMPMETMVLDESQITFNYSFNIDSEFIERYNKAKKALGSDEVKIQALFNDESEKGIYFTLGGKTSHDDKISFQTPNAEMELPSQEFQYNANYLFEIFVENKGAEGIGWFDENGILKLQFTTENSIKSSYYLPPKN